MIVWSDGSRCLRNDEPPARGDPAVSTLPSEVATEVRIYRLETKHGTAARQNRNSARYGATRRTFWAHR